MIHSGLRKVLLLITVGLVACGGGDQAVEGEDESSPEAKPTPRTILTPVEVSGLERRTLTTRLEVSGSVLAIEEVDIVNPEGGLVTAVEVEDGDAIAAGQLLLRIDTSLDSLDLSRLEAELLAAEADVAAIDEDGARARLDRERNLFDQGLSSTMRVEEAEVALRAMDANRLGTAARVAGLRSEIARVERRITLASVRSPIAGRVSSRAVHRGQRAAPGVTLMRVLQMEPVLVELEVGEKDVAWVHTGMAAEVLLEAHPEGRRAGKVRTISPDADATTRAFTVRVEVDNPDELLRPGMYAFVTLPTRSTENALVAPVDAIVRRDGRDLVFVVEGDPVVAVLHEVRTGQRRSGVVEIHDGLDDGDRVVVAGNLELIDGETVWVIGDEPLPNSAEASESAEPESTEPAE